MTQQEIREYRPYSAMLNRIEELREAWRKTPKTDGITRSRIYLELVMRVEHVKRIDMMTPVRYRD